MSNIKQAPFLGLIGLGGGGTGLTSGGSVAKKTWVNDFFDIYLRSSTGAVANVNNGMDLSGDGGLVWTKSRSNSAWNVLYDTSRGGAYSLTSNNSNGQANNVAGAVTFNNNGYSIAAGYGENNASGYTYVDWVFKKQKGFFDIVEWSGNSSTNQTISHNLGCKPGCIIIKSKSNTDQWTVYHRGAGQDKYLYLNETDAASSSGSPDWSNISSTSFEALGATSSNENGYDYVAYLFGGGGSDAATAPSVDFNGSSYLDIADHSDFTFGTDDFTIECWYKADDLNLSNNWDYIFSSGWPVQLGHTVDGANTNSRFSFYFADSNSTSSYLVSNLHTGNGSVNAGQWYHVAVTRSGSTFRIFLNGELKNTATSSGSAPAPNINSAIGRFSPSSPYYYADGRISNFRYVKGTAVYTESFRPPTEPLTAITNTKLLCCNSSSVTGSTVTPGTITNNSATASTDSPFDDPAGFVFGDDGEQNIIKCGYYQTDSNEDADVYLGWEPQWILAKRIDPGSGGNDWVIYDSMRGFMNAQDIEANNGGSKSLSPNLTSSESDNSRIGATSTGIYADQWGANRQFVYIAIRRPDGYVGKLPEAGTDAFAMDTGNSSSTIPVFDSTFPVDFQFLTKPASSLSNYSAYRLMSGKEIIMDTTQVEGSASNNTFDSNVGWRKGGSDSTFMSWMFKRGQGMDVVTWKGQNVQPGVIPHSLGKVPEMMWLRNRGGSDWEVYHKGLNGGSSPETYSIKLNESDAEGNISRWYSTLPTSTHFTVTKNDFNASNENYIAMLFASVPGISKCGFYDGSNSTITITTGFQPRFVIIKRTNAGGSWFVWDTLRGWVAGNNNPSLSLNTSAAQTTGNNYTGGPTSTGFTLNTNADYNGSGGKYIYYAHS